MILEIIGLITGNSWMLYEVFKHYKNKNKINKEFGKLYKLFEMTPEQDKDLNINIVNFIEYIDLSKFLKILSFTGSSRMFENSKFRLKIKPQTRFFKIWDEENNEYDYFNPNPESNLKKEFLKYFKIQCEKNNIKLDKRWDKLKKKKC